MVNQLRVYRPGESGTYVIHTAFFSDNGQRIISEDIVEDFDTRSPLPPFALVRPGIDNFYLEFHPFGVSVFDEALGAVTLTDMAIDNLNRDLYLGQKMTFIPSRMLETDKDGNTVVPRAQDQQCFVAFEDGAQVGIEGEAGKPYEYNPELRVEDNRLAIKTALEILGDRTGLGKDFYSLDDKSGGVRAKTAREVAANQTKLMRTLRKHEESITPALHGLCEALCALAGTCLGISLPDVSGKVCVVYGDSIIEDDAAVRERDREDVAAGLMAPWEYIAKWRALPEEKARAVYADISGPTTAAPEE
jgi:A118 family predicted phage portal protein